jgi:hypothetical protein
MGQERSFIDAGSERRMLFAFVYHLKPTVNEDDSRRLRRLFMSWEPPQGVDIKCHYAFARGGGVAIVDATSPSTIWESLSRFRPWVDIEVEPALSIVEALAISMDVDEWVDSIR